MARRWNQIRAAVKLTAELTESTPREVGLMLGVSWKGATAHPNQPKGNTQRLRNRRRMQATSRRINRAKR